MTLSQLLEVQVKRTPDQIAIVYQERSLTYQELNVASNQLAHYLKAHGVGPGKLVAIYLRRSVEMAIAIWAVLKAGAAYVPLDIADPKIRLHAILEDAQVSAILTETCMRSYLPTSGLILMDAPPHELAQQSPGNPETVTDPHALAYVIYTSGTTGQPKGVMIEHHSVVNLLTGLQQVIYAKHSEQVINVGLMANISFDAAVKQFFQNLYGRTVFIIPEDVRYDGSKLLAYLETNQINMVDCTPTLMEILMLAGLREWQTSEPQVFLIGGEPISQKLWTALRAQSHVDFFNLYGPTECTVDTTVADVQASPDQPTIGYPLPNTEVYLLDSNMQPVPPGVVGEIYIAGDGLARGYLNRAALTEETFLSNPFSQQLGARLYKTGDRARRLNDGSFQFVGRADSQVKVRGFRVELGEIESMLLEHPAIQTLAVVTREGGAGDTQLVAYFVPHPGQAVAGDQLRQFLAERVPSYMLPAVFIQLDSLPITANGKVDLKRLPAPEEARPVPTSNVVAPRDAVEEVLAGHWAQTLNVSSVSIHDNFFELGGNSIGATQMISHLQEFFPTEDPLLSFFFENPTVAGVAQAIRDNEVEAGHSEKIAQILSRASDLTDEEMEALLSEE